MALSSAARAKNFFGTLICDLTIDFDYIKYLLFWVQPVRNEEENIKRSYHLYVF